MRMRMLAVVAACSFFLGRLLSVSWRIPVNVNEDDASGNLELDPTPGHNPLEQQMRDQNTVQGILRTSQHPVDLDCVSARFLILDEMFPKDGFASELQYIARLLQSSLSTRRVLWITSTWKSAYCPDGAAGAGGWACLWQPTTNCTVLPPKGNKPNISNLDTLLNPLSYGISSRRSQSSSFDPYAYGLRKFMDAPMSFPLKRTSIVMDVIPHWERTYGRYWIRSQMSHYLWRPSKSLQDEIDQRLPILLQVPPQPFIGMHIRYTDNIPDFAKGFARNATYTRQLSRYFNIAEQIRIQSNFPSHQHHHQQQQQQQHHQPTIFIATDHANVIEWATQLFQGWTVIGQADNNVQRSTSQQRVWFATGRSSAAGAIATDLEVLRRADYLIGSFQSNVFRLAAQLNTAFNVHKYSVHTMRHFTVDIDWYEDP
jgi:hypothetical protein